ncbi:toprim domain-containing protein [Bradyrhizobium sp. DN5]|uniref:DUF7146 domain-containing protein n=1 Tax=Bradyrhizobium sp. DN5 TaxID=3056950 RepID=UPI00352481D8
MHERGILKALKGRNGQLAGPCPNCGGRDRFGVNLKKGLFNCRGCGTGGGDAIALVQFLDGCDFVRAVETLVGPPPNGRTETDDERRTREQGAIERRERLERERIEREGREAEELRRQHQKASWLWSQRQPIGGTVAELYVREARGITCPLPPTLWFLAPRKPEHHPAMIAAFALPHEVEPGLLGEPRGVEAVHLTLLKPDGSGKADVDEPKIVVGSPGSLPIVLAPPNDLLGLAITEGIEDGLSVFEATGCGVWVAGSAPRMPRLGAAIPSWVECITICADDDKAGRKNAYALAELLDQRGDVEVKVEGLP